MTTRVEATEQEERSLRAVAFHLAQQPVERRVGHLAEDCVALADRIRAALPSPAEAPCTGSDLPKC